MAKTDKQDAVRAAVAACPEKSHRQIAREVGCDQSLVSKARKVVNIHHLSRYAVALQQRHEAILALLDTTTLGGREIAAQVHVSRRTVAYVRANMKRVREGKPPATRVEQMREMARDGHSSRQIAATLGVSPQYCRETMRRAGVDVPGDRATARSKHHKADRIVGQMALDAENVTADIALIDFAQLDPARLSDWIASFAASRRSLSLFITRLIEEQKKHVQTPSPHAQAVESSSGSDQPHARPSRAGDAAAVS